MTTAMRKDENTQIIHILGGIQTHDPANRDRKFRASVTMTIVVSIVMMIQN
jgi:hypothetical protein